MTAASRVVAAVDLGSTSVRCSIAQLSAKNDWDLLEHAEYPLNLLPAIARRRLTRSEFDALHVACRELLLLVKSYGVSAVRYVASPSLREIVNIDVALERVDLLHNINVEILDGAEEGRLYHQALSVLMERRGTCPAGNILLMDIGSSTSSVSWMSEGSIMETLEEHVGTERVSFKFDQHEDSTVLPTSLDRLALGASRVMMNRLRRPRQGNPSIDQLLITGRGPRALARLLGATTTTGVFPSLTRASLDDTFEHLLCLDPLERRAWAKPTGMTSTGLLSALTLMRQLAAATEASHVQIPELELCDGLIADFLPEAYGPHRLPGDQLRAAATEIALRYGMSEQYALNTASLAAQLFDASQPLHHLGERERLLLELAALMHDVGAHINVRSRHKHSYYMLKNLELSGLTSRERDIIAHVARYHRGKAPQGSHVEFARLDRAARMLVSVLAAILRVAYALDVERSQRITRLSCKIVKNDLRIAVDSSDVALERWSMERRGGLFKSVFGLNVSIVTENAV